MEIKAEMLRRGYKVNREKFAKYFDDQMHFYRMDEIFQDWHNERYLNQCYYNLQEKYDCGGITEDKWRKVEEKYEEFKTVRNGMYR